MKTLAIQEAQGRRLREERKRLGYTQEAFGALADVGRLAQSQYEKGETSPTIRYIHAIGQADADIYYIITGSRGNGDERPTQEIRRVEKLAIEMVEEYAKTLPDQQLDSAERYALFDAFRGQLKKRGI